MQMAILMSFENSYGFESNIRIIDFRFEYGLEFGFGKPTALQPLQCALLTENKNSQCIFVIEHIQMQKVTIFCHCKHTHT